MLRTNQRCCAKTHADWFRRFEDMNSQTQWPRFWGHPVCGQLCANLTTKLKKKTPVVSEVAPAAVASISPIHVLPRLPRRVETSRTYGDFQTKTCNPTGPLASIAEFHSIHLHMMTFSLWFVEIKDCRIKAAEFELTCTLLSYVDRCMVQWPKSIL